jgi:hypothetical protein
MRYNRARNRRTQNEQSKNNEKKNKVSPLYEKRAVGKSRTEKYRTQRQKKHVALCIQQTKKKRAIEISFKIWFCFLFTPTKQKRLEGELKLEQSSFV